MLEEVIDCLRCPHCASGLGLVGRTVRCPNGHAFDLARQGYVSLLPGDARAHRGDTAAMVAAREAFLAAGHFDAIADAVAEECERSLAGRPGGCIVDLGAGTGHYLSRVLDRLPDREGIALDASRHALRRAARAHARIGAVGCDAWATLPVVDEAAALVLSVFAPRRGDEIARVLRPGGALLVVAPTGRHLEELVPALGLLSVDRRKRERLDEKLRPLLSPTSEKAWEAPMSLRRHEVAAAVMMGPSAWHADEAAIRRRIDSLPEPLTVTASVTLSVYRRPQSSAIPTRPAP